MAHKKIPTIIILISVLIVLSAQLRVAYTSETPADTRKVLAFLSDVVQLDTAKYEARLPSTFVNYWPWLGGIAQTTGEYVLDSSGLGGHSILTVGFTFWDKELITCYLREESQGPLYYNQQPATNLSDAAGDFLQRYQKYSGDPELAKMKSILETVETNVNATKIIDNVKLEVSVEPQRTLFTWTNSINGADFSRLILEFRDGFFSEFSDDREFRTIGSTEVNISEEDAVSIAIEYVKNYSYKFDGIEVSASNIVQDKIRTQMQVLNKSKPMELYPCWTVDLPLDKVYPGFVTYFEVNLWADTGEVVRCLALGSGGPWESPTGPSSVIPGESTTDPASTNDQTNNNTGQSNALYLVAAVAISITVATAAVVLKKRRK